MSAHTRSWIHKDHVAGSQASQRWDTAIVSFTLFPLSLESLWCTCPFKGSTYSRNPHIRFMLVAT